MQKKKNFKQILYRLSIIDQKLFSKERAMCSSGLLKAVDVIVYESSWMWL